MTPLPRLLAITLTITACGLGAARADDEYATGMQRVKTCTLEASARQLSGETRHSFISDCVAGASLSGSAAAAPADKQRACNLQASDRHLAGDARARFLSDCVKAR
jgi:hypothetical protein